MAPAATAVNPMRAPPQPGTAVKEPARSIVSRMNRRLSAARSSSGTRTGRGERAGSAGAMDYENTREEKVVKFFAAQSRARRSVAFRFPAKLSHEGNKPAVVKRPRAPCVAVFLDAQKPLLVRVAYRNNQPSAFRQLCHERRRNVRCGRGHDNGVERAGLRPA